MKDPNFEFIIVGAGTAGCVLASRLSEKYKVLLLEQDTIALWPRFFKAVPTRVQQLCEQCNSYMTGVGESESSPVATIQRSWSLRESVLRPVLFRGNLWVKTGVFVSKLLVEQTQVSGIEYCALGNAHRIYGKTVILAAGAATNCQLLHLAARENGDNDIGGEGFSEKMAVALPRLGSGIKTFLYVDLTGKPEPNRWLRSFWSDYQVVLRPSFLRGGIIRLKLSLSNQLKISLELPSKELQGSVDFSQLSAYVPAQLNWSVSGERFGGFNKIKSEGFTEGDKVFTPDQKNMVDRAKETILATLGDKYSINALWPAGSVDNGWAAKTLKLSDQIFAGCESSATREESAEPIGVIKGISGIRICDASTLPAADPFSLSASVNSLSVQLAQEFLEMNDER